MFARRYALMIGIDGDGLSGCVADARAMGAHLESPLGGAFDRVDYLLNSDATPSGIRTALATASRWRRDLVAVFYAGHGNRHLLQTARRSFRLEELADLVDSIPSAHRTIILDSCESGGILDALGGVGGLEKTASATAAFLRALHRQRPALRIVTATDREEGASEVGGRGAFTRTLLTVARQATPDMQDDVLSLGWALKLTAASLTQRGFPKPMGFGPLDSFPFAVSDADSSIGRVGISSQRGVTASTLGGRVSAGVEFRGRKHLRTYLRHVVLDRYGRVIHEAGFSHSPADDHEIRTCWFEVPAWMTGVPGLSSRVIARDDRHRVLAVRTGALPLTLHGMMLAV